MNIPAKLAVVVVLAIAAAGLAAPLSRGREARVAVTVPPASLVEPTRGPREIAVLAGGCFWGVEAVFEHVKGVIDVRSGYAGGKPASANYSSVSAGRTGHAEAVRIVFDPRAVGYTDLLRIFFAVAHDPTEINRQGPDVGRQYRSAIFPQSAGQAKAARAYIAQLGSARIFPGAIATRIEAGRFVEAENYHQDFASRNPAHPYVLLHDRPKLAALKRQFPSRWKG